MRFLTTCAALLALCSPLFANDAERDRKARAALALAATVRPAIATAPAPRPVLPKDYAAGYKAAARADKPLVVFVGCKGEHTAPGAVVARADALPGVEGPAAVVLYPARGELYRHTVLRCPVTEDEITTAVRAAQGKVEAPKASDKPAPKPLNWDVRAEVPAQLPACACGDVCPCGGKSAKGTDPRDALARVRKGNAQGSGTVVHSGQGWSLVLTAAHVVDGPGPLTVRVGGKTVTAQVVEADSAADLAALVIPGDFPAVRVSDADVKDGAEVVMYGMTSIYTRGKVAGRETLNGHENLTYATAADSDSGDSGAGVFHEGKLCGVHLGKIGTHSADKPRAAATGPVRRFLSRVMGRGVTAAPKPSQLPAAAPVPAGTIRTTSGRLLVPNGNGTYRYADESPGAAPACPSGRCPLQR